jgi:formamidopyrimidine-DNA glycosylase
VEAGADSEKYPEDWLFSSRWGGKKGRQEIGGKKIIRETVGGRTTAWVPSLQK